MNKKFLVSSIVASSLVVALIAAPKIKLSSASIGLKNDALSSSVYNIEGKTISVILPSTNYRLTKKDLVNLLKSNNVDVSKVFKADGKAVTGENDAIGTGCEIELSNHKKITLVVYGDVTGDGMVNNRDALQVLNGNFSTDAEKKAANVVEIGKEADNRDALRILMYYVASDSNEKIVDEEIYKSDESNVVFDLNKSDVKNPEVEDTPNNENSNVQDNNSNNEQETPKVDTENNITDNNSNEVEDNETTNPGEQGELDNSNMLNPEVTAPETSKPEANEPETNEPEVNEQASHKHTIDSWNISVKATCISQGIRTGKCTVCGEEVTENYIDPNAHETVKIGNIPATCVTYGMENVSECKLCNSRFCSKYVAPLGHSYSNEYTTDTKATCTTDGVKSRHCTREGCTAVTDKTTIAATGHDLVDVVVKATCTTDGTTTPECTKCDYVGKTVVTSNATGHHFVAYDNAVYPTCTTDGHEAGEHCIDCGEEKKGAKIPALGHEYVLMKNSSSGELEPKCIRCKCCMDLSGDDIKFGTGHKWSEDSKSCLCGDPNCTQNSVWWKAWREEGTKNAAIWFVGFKCNLNECIGFDGHRSTYGKKVDVVLEGRRGDVKSIQMTAPKAKDGYEFDGWYEITDTNSGKKIEDNTGNENGTYVSSDGKTITVGWKDMDKGFEARYKKATN